MSLRFKRIAVKIGNIPSNTPKTIAKKEEKILLKNILKIQAIFVTVKIQNFFSLLMQTTLQLTLFQASMPQID